MKSWRASVPALWAKCTARDTVLNRDIALKILPEPFVADPERLARFTREAQALAALNHPNIAHVYGLERSEKTGARDASDQPLAFIAMEFVEGEDLAQRIAGERVPVDEALAIAKQIAEALEAAHEHGLVHRDLKPANIKVRPEGTVKILDFGLAKAVEQTGGGALSMSPTLTSPVGVTMASSPSATRKHQLHSRIGRYAPRFDQAEHTVED